MVKNPPAMRNSEEFLSVGQGRFPGGGNGRLAPVPLLKTPWRVELGGL